MARLRPATPEHVISVELEGSPCAISDGWEPDGLGYGKPRALTENSSGLPQGPGDGGEPGEDVFERDSHSGSVRTEPDIDAIMPLRGTNGQNQMTNVVSPTSSEEVYTRTESQCLQQRVRGREIMLYVCRMTKEWMEQTVEKATTDSPVNSPLLRYCTLTSTSHCCLFSSLSSILSWRVIFSKVI